VLGAALDLTVDGLIMFDDLTLPVAACAGVLAE
jgi:hypothetical protein